MKAVLFQKPWEAACIDVPKPQPGPGQALIRIVSAGICGSDIGAYRGTNALVSYPRIIGHELAGIVEQIPEDNAAGIKPLLPLQSGQNQLLHGPEVSGGSH